MKDKANRISYITMVESSPEKAGVGGSIPSLATLFSKTYRHSIPRFGSNWFQFQPANTCLVPRSVKTIDYRQFFAYLWQCSNLFQCD